MRKLYIFFILLVGVIAGLYLRDFLPSKPAAAKVVTIASRNLEYQVTTKAATVGELLNEQNFASPDAAIDPDPSSAVRSGMTVSLQTEVAITLIDGGNPKNLQTRAATVGDLLDEQKIGLASTDRVTPDLSSYLSEGMTVAIDRIVEVSVTETHEIPYATILRDDPASFYGQQQVLAAGKSGQKEQDFLITYKNGVEIKRKLLAERVLAKPVSEIRSFGTKIAVEEAVTGRASWYSYQNCMCAAHPFYAKGRFVRVTDLATGKSIIVEVNDRGPDLSIHPDRVIDLDAVAFRALAPLAVGTIGVKVELLQNGL